MTGKQNFRFFSRINLEPDALGKSLEMPKSGDKKSLFGDNEGGKKQLEANTPPVANETGGVM